MLEKKIISCPNCGNKMKAPIGLHIKFICPECKVKLEFNDKDNKTKTVANQIKEKKNVGLYGSKDDIYALRLIMDLLFHYNITNKDSLNKLCKNASKIKLLLKYGIALSISYYIYKNYNTKLEVTYQVVLGFDVTYKVILEILVIAYIFIRFIFFLIASIRLKFIKRGILKICMAGKVGVDYIYESLSEKYGEKLCKILKN